MGRIVAGRYRSPPPVNTRKVIVLETSVVGGYATETDPPEPFIVLTDPPPRKFVCSGATIEDAKKRAEEMGYSFERDPEPFPSDEDFLP